MIAVTRWALRGTRLTPEHVSCVAQVIYDLLDHVNELIVQQAPKRYETVEVGVGEVQKVFMLSGAKKAVVAGCVVNRGALSRALTFEVVRGGSVIFTGKLNALKHLQDEVDSVASGQECGLSFADFTDIQEGDTIKCFEDLEI